MSALVAAIRAAAVAQGVEVSAALELARNASMAVRGVIADAVEHRVANFELHADPDVIADASMAALDRTAADVALADSSACDRIFNLEHSVRRHVAARRRLRRERDVARRQLAALRRNAQRLALLGRVDVLGAELPDVWSAS